MPGFLILLLLLSFATQAEQIYQWTDESGVIHFSDSPVANARRIEVRPVNVYQAPVLRQKDSTVSPEPVKQPKVVMYGTAWCGVCKKARAWFRDKGVRYTEHDVEKSEQGKADYQRMQGKGVPIFLVDGKRINGFSASRFEKLLSSSL